MKRRSVYILLLVLPLIAATSDNRDEIAAEERIIEITEWRVPWDGRPRDPNTGEIRKYMMPDDMSARDPHTMAVNEDGNVWYCDYAAG